MTIITSRFDESLLTRKGQKGYKSEKVSKNRKIEDLIVDRLCAFKFWGSGVDGLNALIMLELGAADRERVEQRAGDEDVLDALDYLEEVLEDSTRLKMTPSETSMMLMKYFRK